MDALEVELRRLVPYVREVTFVPNQYNTSSGLRVCSTARLDFKHHCIYVDLDGDMRPLMVELSRNHRMDMSTHDEDIREEALERLRLLDAAANIRRHFGIHA